MSSIAATMKQHPGATIPARRDRRRAHGARIAGPIAWALALAAALAIVGSLPTLGSGAPSRATSSITVRVATSDTLWSIAAAHPAPGLSTASTVDEIARMNGLRTSSVRPGSLLKVPAMTAPDAAFAQVDGVSGTR
jgi:hypothetical protein